MVYGCFALTILVIITRILVIRRSASFILREHSITWPQNPLKLDGNYYYFMHAPNLDVSSAVRVVSLCEKQFNFRSTAAAAAVVSSLKHSISFYHRFNS